MKPKPPKKKDPKPKEVSGTLLSERINPYCNGKFWKPKCKNEHGKIKSIWVYHRNEDGTLEFIDRINYD